MTIKLTYYLMIFLLTALLILQQRISYAQTKESMITGTVSSAETHSKLAGASLTLKYSKTNVVTLENGSFAIRLRTAMDTLFISHVGYESVLMAVTKGTKPLTIHLKNYAQQLDEVIVNTGYQAIPKERVTGSFETVGSEFLNRRVSTDIISRLEGTSTILFDKSNVRPNLTIRGLSSIEGPKDPLIILDNFPYEGDINNINPNDVENITILKDAAAASIWGTRAGNGVIVITTKKGRLNQPFSISLNTNITVVKKPDLWYLKQMSSSDFIDVEQYLFGQEYYNSLETDISRPALSPVVELLIKERDGQLSGTETKSQIDALRKIDVRNDFSKYVYRNEVNRQYSLQLRGGSNKLASLVSINLDKNINTLNAGYSRLNFRAENIFKPTTNFQLSTGVTYTYSKSSSGRQGYENFTQLYPYASLADQNGNALPVARYRQTYIDTAGKGKLLNWNYYPLEDYRHNKTLSPTYAIIANAGALYQFLQPLNIEVKYQYQKQQTESTTLMGAESFYTRDLINSFTQIDPLDGSIKYIVPQGAIADRTNEIIQSHNIRGQLNYNQDWNKSSINAIAGAELREILYTSNSYRVYGYNENILSYANVDYANPYPNFITTYDNFIPAGLGQKEKTNHFISYYTNAAYTYDSRYTVSASARRDASNLFGVKTNDKWQPLWSVGSSWNIDNEKFYKSTFLPTLKLRATYGNSGNVDQSRSAVTTLSYIGIPAPYTNLPFSVVSQFANPSLRWEKVNILNLAISFATNKEIVSGSIDYYIKKGTDLFGNAPIDYTTGLGVQNLSVNAASMKGNGFDVNLSSRIIDKKLKWSCNLLFNYNKARITKYYLSGTSGSNYLGSGINITPLEGKPVYSILSYKWAGLDSAGNPQGIIDGKPSTNYSELTGDVTKISDLVYSGPALPPFYGSFNTTLDWKGIALSIGITYKLGHYFRKESVNYGQLFLYLEKNADFSRRWQKPGDEHITSVPSLIYPDDYSRDAFYSNSEILVDKADHIRLQYVNISYDVTKSAWKKIPVKNLQFYINTYNLGIIWRANKVKIDPDYPNSVIPPARSISIGLRANL